MTSTSWLSRDLNVQALDKMRKLSDSEQTAYECWVYQENNQFFVTDLNTRLKVTINPKKLNKIKSQFVNKPNNTNLRSSTNSNSTVNSSSHELVRILVKQYLYSSMIDFKSKKKEPFVFMFLEDFDVSTGKNLAKKATDLNKLNIGTHPSVNRPTIAEKHPTSTNTNIVTRSASKTVLKENTPMATYSPKPSPMRVSDHLRAYTKQKTAEKQKSEKREEEEKTKEKQTSGSSNLSQLINQISQDSSLQDCTIEMIATTPTRMKTRRAGLGENEKKRTEPMNLDEGFFKSGNTQSTLGSTMSSNHSDDLLLLDVESQQILDKKNGGLKLSSQCPTNFSQFDVNCSVISCAPDECSKSSIKITRKTSKAKVQAATVEADPVDQEMRSCEDDENNRVENTVHVADKDETRIPPLSNPDRIIVRDTQAIAASNENGQTQNSPSQLLKRRDTVTSAISDMSTSIFEWPVPLTAACSTMDAFTSSTLNYSLFGGAGVGIMCQPTTTATTGASATKRRKKKLFSQHDRACFNDDGDDDDDEEDDDLNESASQYNYRSTHNTPSNARFSRAKMLSSKTASIQKALTPLPTTPSRRRRADESADSTERRSSSESGAGRNQGADDEAKRIRTLLTSSSSSSSTSSLVSFDDDLEEENSSCVTSATANTTNKAASALLFKPRHLFEYKRRLMARRAETERKPTLLTTVSSSASIASSRINNRLFSVRDIFSPSRYNPRKRTMTTITPPSSNRQQQLVNDTGSEPRHQQLLRANSRLLDNAVSLDLGPANKDQNAQRFNSNTSQNSTPSRRRLFDPKNQDINHAFGMITHPTAPTPSKKMNTLSIQPQRSISESRNNNITTTTTTTTSSYPDITSMNNTTATTTTTTSSDQTTATTSSSDKSIPGGQYPNNQAVAANDTNNDTNKTTSILDPHSNMFDHKFSLNVDDFQDFLAIKNSLVESSADHV